MAQSPYRLTDRTRGRAGEVDRLRQRVDDLRAAIGWDVYEIRSRVRGALDVRSQIEKHPFVTAALVLGGVLIATGIVRLLRRRNGTGDAKGPVGDASRTLRLSRTHRGVRPGAREALLKEVSG